MPGPHRLIEIAGGGMPKTSQNGRGKGLQGEHNQKSTMADRPQDGGPGNRRPPRQMPLGNWLKLREDGRMKRRAVAGSPALW